MTEPVGGVSRRRVMQGMAWATPAIVIATAVPARAASTDVPNFLIVSNAFQVIDSGELEVQLQLQWQGVEPEGYLTPAINPCYVHLSIPNAAQPGTPTVSSADGVYAFAGSGADPVRPNYTVYTYQLVDGLSSSRPSATFGADVPLAGSGTGTGYAWGTGTTTAGPATSNVIEGTITIPPPEPVL